MSEDAGAAAEGTATGPDGSDSAASATAANGQAATATGAQGAASGQDGTTAAGGDDAAAELLASMAETGDGEGDSDGKPDPLQAQLDHWKTIAKKQEQRAKSNAAAAKELEDIKRSQMSAQERLEAERDAYRAEAAEKGAQLHRVMAAAAYDLPASLIDHLGGGTEEEINARAEAFAAAINERAATNGQGNGQQNGHATAAEAAAAVQQQPPNPFFRNRVPVESLRAGAAPASDNVARNSNDLFRQMLGR